MPPGDALSLARSYLSVLGVRELYAADLDAILRGQPQRALVAALAGLGAPLWLDAAIADADDSREALALGAARVVVGLETLPSLDALTEICDAIGGEHVVFSLDLRAGVPLARPGVVENAGDDDAAVHLAVRAAESGVATIALLDLARVGMGTGPDVALVARVRAAVGPAAELMAAGGVRGPDDLARLAAAGADGALVATALLDGRLTASDVAAAAELRRRG
jgi:phosphoribosylformimino-5-aminoimidazole carboxamide ribotide isomerase